MRLVISVLGIWYLQSQGFNFSIGSTICGAGLCMYAFFFDLTEVGIKDKAAGNKER